MVKHPSLLTTQVYCIDIYPSVYVVEQERGGLLVVSRHSALFTLWWCSIVYIHTIHNHNMHVSATTMFIPQPPGVPQATRVLDPIDDVEGSDTQTTDKGHMTWVYMMG